VQVAQVRQAQVRQVLVQTQFFLVLPQQVVVGAEQRRLQPLCQQQVALVAAADLVNQVRLVHRGKDLLGATAQALMVVVAEEVVVQ
jgi:hypothetical protein